MLRTATVALFLIGFLFASCKATRSPHRSFDEQRIPPAPDYSQLDNWAALPFTDDPADSLLVGYGLSDGHDTAQADVFYIHPTTYSKKQWNAPADDSKARKGALKAVLFQASTFNSSGRVFAPYYRQMTYYGFFTKDSISRKQAVELAYSDVRSAFLHYLKEWNDGRPVILVGHSQGALMGQMLLREFFAPHKAMSRKLIVAYLPGWPVNVKATGGVKACRNKEDIACFASWNTFSIKGNRIRTFYKEADCVNPVSWKSEGGKTPLDWHKGALDGKYKKIYPAIIQAQCEDHVLRITTDQLPFPYKYARVFHVGDVNLFWMDIRLNAALRFREYQKNNN